VFGIHNGPQNSRLSQVGLFENHEFLFIGDFSSNTITLDSLVEVSKRSGAQVKRKAREFSEKDQSKVKVVLFDETKKKISFSVAFHIKQSGQIKCVNKSWLLDSLACYKIRDSKEYETYDMAS
jgi:hypothetical protein